MTEFPTHEQDQGFTSPTAEQTEQEPIITPQARFIARVFMTDPVGIPEEYQNESIVLVNKALAVIPTTHSMAIKRDIGLFGQKPPTDVPFEELSKKAQRAYQTARMTAFHKKFYGDLLDLAPIDKKSIGRRLMGPIIRRVASEQIPNAPFNYSMLSQNARDELSSFGQTSGYGRMNLAFLSIVEDPGLSEETIEELQREMRNQLQ